MQTKQKNRGFTLIELVVVIAILAILAAFALPRFAQLSEQAHQSSVRATAGALGAGVALAKAQWVTNGFTTSTQNLAGFGDGELNMSNGGWPVDWNGSYEGESGDDSAVMTADLCQSIWNGVLQANAPSITGTEPDYVVSTQAARGSVAADTQVNCLFTYQGDGSGTKTIMYDPDTGAVISDVD